MRIVSGAWRGRPIEAPAGLATRPTSERAREAIFSMLVSRIGSFEGLRVLDLFAGSGAMGLEALSRGAAHATFVDHDRAAVAAITASARALGCLNRTDILQGDAAQLARAAAPCHVVFVDAPYGEALTLPAIRRSAAQGWFAPGAMLSVETGKDEALLLDGFDELAARRYGKALVRLLRYQPEA